MLTNTWYFFILAIVMFSNGMAQQVCTTQMTATAAPQALRCCPPHAQFTETPEANEEHLGNIKVLRELREYGLETHPTHV